MKKSPRCSTTACVVLTLLAAGCGQHGPTLAGGKPVSFWIEALRDPNANVRTGAVNKLGNVGLADADAFTAVVQALQDHDPGVRKAAVRALPKFGKRTREAIAAVTKTAAEDADPEVSAAAAQLLEALNEGHLDK